MRIYSWASLVTKRSIEICGKGHLATSPEERNGFNEDQKFCQEKQFTSFAQCNKRCKRNMQIEIPSKIREGQYLFSTPPNYYTFYYLVPAGAHHSYRKTLFSPTSLFNIWNFLFRQIKLRWFYNLRPGKKLNFENLIWGPISFKWKYYGVNNWVGVLNLSH